MTRKIECTTPRNSLIRWTAGHLMTRNEKAVVLVDDRQSHKIAQAALDAGKVVGLTVVQRRA